jgi:hypothetical protein
VPIEERFCRHVTRTESCWLWTGLHRKSGAGIMPVRQAGKVKRLEAARVAWELFVGPLPPGRRVWRRCRRPACVRPDHLVLGRRGQSPEASHSKPDPPSQFDRGARPDSRRTWWTRERVLAGLVAFNQATGQAPTTSRGWSGLIQRMAHQQPRMPSAYAVLRHFPNFRAAWTAAGIELADARWAPWTVEQDRYIVTQLGVQPTIAIAEALARGEAAVRARARKLGLRVGTARGWPLQRAARAAGVSEYVLRTYIKRGELPSFKGAKHVYVDPAALRAVREIDWRHPPAELESGVAAFDSQTRTLDALAVPSMGKLTPSSSAPAHNSVAGNSAMWLAR